MMPIDPSRGYIGGPSCVEPYPGFHDRHRTMNIVTKSDNFEGLASQYGAALRRENARLDRQLAEMDLILENLEEKRNSSSNSGNQQNSSSNSGCFIATAAYGSPFHERIDVLRCWRDVRLRQSKLTAPLVRWYYAMSPPIARCVARSKTLRFLVRAALKPTIWLISIQVQNEFQGWEDDRSLPRAVDYHASNSDNKNMEREA